MVDQPKSKGKRRDDQAAGGRQDRDREDRPYDRKRDQEWRRKYRDTVERAIRQYWQRENREHPHATPWLLIRYATGDIGLRPLPGGINFWTSPDIWVESSDSNGNAVAGEQNFVWARIFNLGMRRAAPVRVDFYWANPALGLGPANMNKIGTEWVEIKSQFSRTIRCSQAWVPQYLNNGHECLMVNCTNEPYDPITVPFSPTTDRHVGQRNIHVEKGAAGKILSFSLELNNFLPLNVHTIVLANAVHLNMTATYREKLTRVGIINRIATLGTWIPSPREMRGLLRSGSPEYLAARSEEHTSELQSPTN